MKRSITIVASLALLAAVGLASAWATGWLRLPGAGRELAVSSDNLQNVQAMVPAGDPQGVAILVSDHGGAVDEALAASLVDRNIIVLPVNLDTWLTGLQKDAEDCLYTGSDVEGIAKEVQRSLDLQNYFHPVVVGSGAGGLFAYATVADSPAATMAGGIAIDPAATLETTLPICDGAAATKGQGGYAYDWSAELPETFMAIGPQAPAGIAAGPHRAVFHAAADPAAQRAAAVDAVVDAASADATSMPIIIAAPKGPPRAVAVFFSGDGGWRDLDKSIGDWLGANGVEVLGVDSLRYFWSEKTPQRMGDDIGAILDNALVPDGVPVALMGYSFGADTLPFAWPEVPQKWRDRVSNIILLAPGLQTGFEISIGGWFGMATGEKPVPPAVAALPRDKLLCVFGVEDGADSACNAAEVKGARTIETGGGHHFDGDYDSLAARLLKVILNAGP